ncbi:hypothetical protein NN561_018389 [Cricetulus griseus]
MLAPVSAYETRPTAKLQVPKGPAQACCGFPGDRRESEFSDQASPEAAGAPGKQREEAEVWWPIGCPVCPRVGAGAGPILMRQDGGPGPSTGGEDQPQPVRTLTAGLT